MDVIVAGMGHLTNGTPVASWLTTIALLPLSVTMPTQQSSSMRQTLDRAFLQLVHALSVMVPGDLRFRVDGASPSKALVSVEHSGLAVLVVVRDVGMNTPGSDR